MKKDNRISFQEIKERVNVKEVLEEYGLLEGFTEKEDELKGFCPFEIDDGYRKKSFYINPSKKCWHCFSCNEKGSILDLVAKLEGVGLKEAGEIIQERFLKSTITSKPASQPASKPVSQHPGKKDNQAINSPLTFQLKNLDQDHPYLKERGLTEETIKEFGLGYYPGKGILNNRVLIPIHNEKGELVAYAGRRVEESKEEPKYLFPPKFQKHLVLFNLHRITKDNKPLILVEGFFDCFRIWQLGFKNVSGLMGTEMSKEQESLLIDTIGRQGKLLIFFDNDKAGQKALHDISNELVLHCFIKIIKLQEEQTLSQIPDSTLGQLLKDSL